ncbi:MAG: universal stress protein [Desulfobacteraceae bacterium]|nr:universal stress protein [Desulfobacteraceae bacterium]
MFPLRKIINPTDFSEPSQRGTEAAVKLAETFHSELILVHAVTPLPIIAESSGAAGYHLPTVMEDLEQQARDAMDRLVETLIPRQIHVRSLILHGMPANEIARAALEESTDLIVMATHGESGWKRFFFGSVTERVVHIAEVSVLTIRPPKQA